MKEFETQNAFHPGEYLRDEIEARGWTPSDLADILGIRRNIVSDLLVGRRSVSPAMAKDIAEALGTSAQFWLNLQSAFSLAQEADRKTEIAHKARVYSMAPVSEMVKRRWIEATTNLGGLEREICKFYGIKTIDEPFDIAHAARKSEDYSSVSMEQVAWFARAKSLAPIIQVECKYDDQKFDALLSELKLLIEYKDEIRNVPRILAKYGVRFLVVEKLKKTKIDGACFWLDKDSPVIVLSLRYDRIDNFWQTLIHELNHVRNREGQDKAIIDSSMFGKDAQPFAEKPKEEQAADLFAVKFLVSQDELEEFIVRTNPYFSRSKIEGFAYRLKIHPGVVVGQLQYRSFFDWSYFRPLLESVRHIVLESSLYDGWGQTA